MTKRCKAGPGPEYIQSEGNALFNAYFSNNETDENSTNYYPSFDAFVNAHASKRYRDYVDELRRERAAEAAKYDVYHAG